MGEHRSLTHSLTRQRRPEGGVARGETREQGKKERKNARSKQDRLKSNRSAALQVEEQIGSEHSMPTTQTQAKNTSIHHKGVYLNLFDNTFAYSSMDQRVALGVVIDDEKSIARREDR